MLIDPNAEILDYEGKPLVDSKLVVLNEDSAIEVALDPAGEPVYFEPNTPEDQRRKPRPLTLRLLVFKALNVGINPTTQDEADKPLTFSITAKVMAASGDVDIDEAEEAFILKQLLRRRSALEHGRVNEIFKRAKDLEAAARVNAETAS